MPSRRWTIKSAAALGALGIFGTSALDPKWVSNAEEDESDDPQQVGPEDRPADEGSDDPGEEPPDEEQQADEASQEESGPTTRDVTEYGATGDGRSNDTQAIRNALAAAESGDTIYFPPGDYLVGTVPPDGAGILPIPTDVDNLTIAGESGYETSRVVVSRARYRAGQNFSVFRMKPANAVRGLTFRDLTLDGNRSNTDLLSSKGFYLDPDGASGGHTILVEDCWAENFNGPALLFRQGRVHLNRVTSMDNKQNFGVSERDDSTAGTDQYGIVLTDCYSENADWVGIDHNQGGRVKIENLYSADNGRSGLKSTKDNRRTRIENATFHNENSYAAIRTNISTTSDLPDPPLALSLDTVAIREAKGGGLYISGDDSSIQNSALLDGPVELRNCGGNNDGSHGSVTVHSAGGGNVEELRVIGTGDGPAVWFGGKFELSIGRLYHADNDGGAYEVDDQSGELSISEAINSDPGQLNTPTRAAVGAWSW